MKTLILGGARSGKSAWAERQAAALGLPVTVIATARGGDAEMNARIAQHKASRPEHWTTVEEPLALGSLVEQLASPGQVLIIDCLTLWLSNLLFDEGISYPEQGLVSVPAGFVLERDCLLQALIKAEGHIYLVSNEVGLGVVPLGAGNRLFIDEAGRLNQQLAGICESAVFMAAGLPLSLKGERA